MKTTKRTLLGVAVAMALGSSNYAFANTTSSSVKGQITGPSGNPASGTVVTIVHEPSGTVKKVVANTSGNFSAQGLRVGGPYTIVVDSDTFEDVTVNDVYLQLGDTEVLEFALKTADMETISVTGSRTSIMALGKDSPAANFNLAMIENSPSINRDIADVIRIDPRVYVDEGGAGGIQCNGKSPRFNSLTVDGVRQDDSFGLNSNGYPTERMPFPYDSIEQVAVEMAPFEVIYGGFTACSINAVTKSGTNELTGSFFYDYTGDDFNGDSLEGDAVEFGDFSEKRYGFSIGAPIIEDKLFIFANYEKLEGANLLDRGAIGSGAVQEVNIEQSELNEIAQIASDLYSYNPGIIPSSLSNEDEKLLVKVDWNISDEHRLAVTYQYNDGNNFTGADRDSNEIEFLNHHYERGAELTSIVGSLYSDWSETFSTEIRIIDQSLDNRQLTLEGDGTVGGANFGEVRVETDDVDVFLGSDDSRQANDLDWDKFSLSFRGNYYFDNGHTVTFGYERDELEVFNVFVQHTETEIRFASIDDFRNGLASAIYYNNAPSGNPEDAAAVWGYETNAAYIQDEFYLTDELLVTAGFRHEWYTSSDKPVENADFVADYGYSNSTNLDGLGLFQPRIGLNYSLDESTDLRGGIGLYSGGNPNVWLSNNFSNNNVLQFGDRGRRYCYTADYERRAVIDCPSGQRSLFDEDIIWRAVEAGNPEGPGYGIPSELYDSVSAGAGDNFDINVLDPDFVLPSEWKLAAGFTHVTATDYVFDFDVIVSITQDQGIVKFGGIEAAGLTADGYVDYDRVASVSDPDSSQMSSLILTNTSETATSYSLSGSVSKDWDNGINLIAGYAFNNAEDVQPMNSAVAFSNFQYRAFTNPNEEVLSLSDWNIKHRLTANLTYTAQLFGDFDTVLSAYAVAQSGRPYSNTLSQDDSNGVFGFTPYLDDGNVLPMGESRNDEESPWWSKIDIAVRQQIPAFTKNHKASIYVNIDNFTNMLNDEWGILEQPTSNIGSVARVGDASLWSMRIGVNYKF